MFCAKSHDSNNNGDVIFTISARIFLSLDAYE
ncbi:hypothetical protein PAND9192_01045 [Photobacterium andalusiense]|uniref:Uncharacterized protein n=1 Tax=Photobacterium andalusiense TaxID=2204296 RepID=A0A1Y6MC98_9GAMM|nr:hypothetical protein PAND9192_01045 [Photobacterium andalusiense]